uniref:Uncharacterized protein n=1 Tax=Hemiselmis andersenii TaxID=464988 RepID=A0A6T8KF76_HEMAN|mmetsp:Transcript_18861/g.43549  ORF Transcript_18861/g.43549 Transcript_18861/m.43549 type:complete len:104 (+) Transcript_18861:275-586(+)
MSQVGNDEFGQSVADSIDPVMIMRIPTMISGICIAFVAIMQVHWYSNMRSRELFMSVLGVILVGLNMVFIFFASIHCPSLLYIKGQLARQDCEKDWLVTPWSA